MRILLLGSGMQGRGALHDLAGSADVTEIVVADRDVITLEAHVRSRALGAKVRCRSLDAADEAALARLMAEGFDAAIDLLPSPLGPLVARVAVGAGLHLVNTNFVSPEVRALGRAAEAHGVAILPEFGMDPGLDLVLLGESVRGFDEVTEVVTYGSGIPEPAAADNPIRYKVSWSLEGVLRAYRRGARLVRESRLVEVGRDEQFLPRHVHEVVIEGLGPLEAYPNGDAVELAGVLGLDTGRLRSLARYTLRYPGHSAFWGALVALGLLDDGAVVVDGVAVDRRRYLAAALEPRLRYREGEADLAIIRNEVAGRRGGRGEREVREVVARRDAATGLSAMSRLTGFTASIGAQLLARGVITRRGILSPAVDVPAGPLLEALGRRGIEPSRALDETDSRRRNGPSGRIAG